MSSHIFQPPLSENCLSHHVRKVFKLSMRPYSTPHNGNELLNEFLSCLPLFSIKQYLSKKRQKKPKLSFPSMNRRSTSSSSTHVFMFLRQTEPETLEISRAAEIFQTTLQVLKNRARQRYKRDVTAPGRIAFLH